MAVSSYLRPAMERCSSFAGGWPSFATKACSPTVCPFQCAVLLLDALPLNCATALGQGANPRGVITHASTSGLAFLAFLAFAGPRGLHHSSSPDHTWVHPIALQHSRGPASLCVRMLIGFRPAGRHQCIQVLAVAAAPDSQQWPAALLGGGPPTRPTRMVSNLVLLALPGEPVVMGCSMPGCTCVMG